MTNTTNQTSNMMTFDAACEMARTELTAKMGKRAAAREVTALVNAAIEQRADLRSAAELAKEFGVSKEIVEAIQTH